MLVMKFGGSSVGTPERISSLVPIIAAEAKNHNPLVVVVSAFSGVTDALLALCKQAAKGDDQLTKNLESIESRHIEAVNKLIPPVKRSAVLADVKVLLNELSDVLRGVKLVKESSLRTTDQVISFGERLSALIVAETLKANDQDAKVVDARDIIVTDSNYSNAQVDWTLTTENAKKVFASIKEIAVVPGFIAKNKEGDTTTLGRGGSDYTASILGAALSVKEVQIWTDVNGVMTSDPRKVKNAFSLPAVTFDEMMELSHFGAKVVYPPTLQPAMDFGVAVRILNTFDPKHPGTLISAKTDGHDYPITGISSIDDVSLLRIEGSGMVGISGTASRVFHALASVSANVILITQASSEHTICLAVKPEDAKKASLAIDHEFFLERSVGKVADVLVEGGFSIISAVGENMRRCAGVSGRLFGALGRYNVNIVAIAQGSSELNISCVISKDDLAKALNVVHDEFFLNTQQSAHIFLVGTGLVGKELLKQLASHSEVLHDRTRVRLRLNSLANSKRMEFSEKGLSFDQAEPKAEAEKFSLNKFIEKVNESNLPHSIFVDCTANQEVTSCYAELLSAGVAVVTPNKKLQSGPLAHYLTAKKSSQQRGAPFLFETSVGAGLPVISTLNDLINSGDKILKIQGVLSGTLGFLLGQFSQSDLKFSELVKTAKEKGLTEPDPRDDLCGLDVARKLVILAREAGYSIELSDVKIESLVPADLKGSNISSDDFMKKLSEHDQSFESKRSVCKGGAKKLCYIAQFDGQKAEVGVHTIDASSPFFALRSEENMVAFTTTRYSELPLIVRGPGAGASVTAAGVMADIVRIALRR